MATHPATYQPNEVCFYCGRFVTSPKPNKIRDSDKTRDHVHPRSKGGGEIVTACRKCNGDKGSLTLEEYRLVVMYRRGLIKKDMITQGYFFFGERKPEWKLKENGSTTANTNAGSSEKTEPNSALLPDPPIAIEVTGSQQ